MLKITSRTFSLFTAIVGILSLIAGISISVEFIRYPLFTVSLASLLFSVQEYLPAISLGDLSPEAAKSFDSIVFLLIVLTAILSQVEPAGVLDFYYVVAITTAGILAYRFARSPVRPIVAVAQIILFALVLRSTLWFSYPVYGADRFHFGAVGWIITRGSVVPESITYYNGFPLAHIFVATWTMLANLSLKVGYFGLGIAQAVSLIAVFTFIRKILHNTRPALFGTLFVAVAGYHIKSGGEPFAQALLTGLMPVIFLLLFRRSQDDKRKVALLIILVAVGILTQNIAPVILVGVAGMIFITRHLILLAKPVLNVRVSYDINIIFPFLFLQIGFIWYYVVDYLDFQVLRIVRILLFQSGTGQTQVENTGVAGVPKVVLFQFELPGVLMWAAPILASALLVGLADYFSIREVLSDRIEDVPVQYVLLASLIFAGLTGVFAAGSRDAVRALPVVVVLISPLVAFVINEFRVSRGQVGAIIASVLIVIVAFSGTVSPGVAKAEISDDDYHKTLKKSQVASAEFVMQYSSDAISGPYVQGYERISQVSAGEFPSSVIKYSFNVENATSIHSFQVQSESGETTIYLDYYSRAFGLSRPETNRVYASGNSTVYQG